MATTPTATTTTPAPRRLDDGFRTAASRQPDAAALIVDLGDRIQTVSFAELQGLVADAAERLRRVVGHDGGKRAVGICCRRGDANVVGMLAALRADAPFVPLDAASPDRLRFVASDAGLAAVFAEPGTLEDLRRCDVALPVVMIGGGYEGAAGGPSSPAPRSSHSPPSSTTFAEDVAYVLYTSGSTGRPKGVEGTHAAMLNRFDWAYRRYPYDSATEVAVHKTSLGFVDSIFEILGPLGAGVPLLVPPASAKADPDLLIATLARHRVTRLILVPSLLRAMLSVASAGGLGAMLPRLKYWTTSGEALSFELMGSFFRSAPAAALLNLYGSTEVAADVTCAEFTSKASADDAQRRATSSIVPIGLSIDGCGFLVLEPESLEEIPEEGGGAAASAKDAEDATGVGEIFVYGKNLANGYVNRPDLDAAAFVTLRPITNRQQQQQQQQQRRRFEIVVAAGGGADGDDDGEGGGGGGGGGGECFRAFRTGDFGYVQAADKALCYVGRRDQQVKIRGQRVDLLEVEANLRGLPRVATAAVALLKKGGSGMEQIAAYVVPEGVGNAAGAGAVPSIDQSALRRGLADKVPPYAVPSLMLPCTTLPLLPNGKLDRAALKRPLADPANPAHAFFLAEGSGAGAGGDDGAEDGEEWATETQRELAAIWREMGLLVFKGGGTEFYAAGGDSLRLVSLVVRIRERFQKSVRLVDLATIDDKTVVAMAEVIDEAPESTVSGGGSGGSGGAVCALMDGGARTSTAEAAGAALRRRYIEHHGIGAAAGAVVEAVFPLSAMQQGILFHCLMHTTSSSSSSSSVAMTSMYVQQSVFRLDGVVHVPRFRRAWSAVLAKHPLLRSYADADFLTPEGRPALVTIASANTAVPLTVTESSGSGSSADDLIDEERRSGGINIGSLGPMLSMDADTPDTTTLLPAPLLRLRLIRASHDAWFLVMAIHHLIMDGWSLEIVFRDLADAYEALGEATAKDAPTSNTISSSSASAGGGGARPVPCAFKATVEWEDRAMAPGSDERRETEQYWAGLLKDWRPPLALVEGGGKVVRAAGNNGVGKGEEEEREKKKKKKGNSNQDAVRARLEGPLSERVQATAQRHGLTVNAIIHGAWALLQSHYEVSGEKKGRNEH
jgi:amino acid adenylation domain-containing protein